MEDRETPRLRKYGESKTTRIMMATVPHVTSGLGLRKFLDRWIFVRHECTRCILTSVYISLVSLLHWDTFANGHLFYICTRWRSPDLLLVMLIKIYTNLILLRTTWQLYYHTHTFFWTPFTKGNKTKKEVCVHVW